jgi:sugar phosphate isomerase/epimerase
VQLYTVRGPLSNNPRETLKGVADIGYSTIETAGIDILHNHGSYIKDLGLTPVSAHFNFMYVTGNADNPGISANSSTEEYDQVIRTASDWNMKYVVLPYLPAEMRGGIDDYKKLSEQMNYAAEIASDAGLKFCYHNHSFELEPMEDTTPMETIFQYTDPELVGIEADLFWIGIGGIDPVQFMKDYAGRITLVHLKDKAADAPQSYSGAPSEAFKEVGSGVFNFTEILATAADTGVEHGFVEQDQTPGDPLASIRKSYNYLQSLKA